jgi:hypothetical protein
LIARNNERHCGPTGNCKEDYEKMNLNMIYGNAPSFDTLVEKLNGIQSLIREK